MVLRLKILVTVLLLIFKISLNVNAQDNKALEEVKVISFAEALNNYTSYMADKKIKNDIFATKIIHFPQLIPNCEYLKDKIIRDFDKECFLVGTLDDYGGHSQTFTASVDSSHYQMVDIYFQEEKPLASLINNLYKDTFSDLHITNNQAPKGINLYSRILAKIIDGYYDYKPSRSYTLYGDTVYTGYLKKYKIASERQKRSFLAGVFLRYGSKTEISGTYCIAMANSVSKAELSKSFLEELGCSDIQYDIKKENIPVGYLLLFKPSDTILNIIQEFDSLTK
jgi:hypothetical protein